MKKQSKKARIQIYLQSGNTLTGKQALVLFGVYRLSSVINRLRNEGHNIITTKRADIEGNIYGEYRMSK
jgi:hypothetical protein